MRPVKKRPRILSAKYISGLTISAVFNNGETRIIDFRKLFANIKIARNSPAAKLLKPEAFKKFKIENGTLSWKNVLQEIPWGNEIRKVPFEVGADTLYKNSQKSELPHRLNIGELIRNERLAAQMTQGALAERSGTTAGYISKIESNKSGIELDTLQKLVEIGLGKKLLVSFK